MILSKIEQLKEEKMITIEVHWNCIKTKESNTKFGRKAESLCKYVCGEM